MERVEPYKGIAGIYDEIRPSYPEELIRDVICKTQLGPTSRLLEIGAGTGKATVQFAEKGFAIDAVELGEDMAAILKDKCASYPRVSVDVAPFENWNPHSNEKYDMVYAAQAFHWLAGEVKYRKCHELLKDDGYLVLFWYNSSNYRSPQAQAIEEEVQTVVREYASDYRIDKRRPKRRAHDGRSTDDERTAEIEASGLFSLVEKLEYRQDVRNSATKYLMVLKSVPTFASILDGLDEETVRQLDNDVRDVVNRHGGFVGASFNFSLYIAKRLSP